jgi:hypothetical protein
LQNYSAEFLAQQREIKAIRKDISVAYGIIADGLMRYKKKQLHARNKQQAEDMSMFAELDVYGSKTDIQDVYGWGDISEATMYRLLDLWDVREQVVANNGKFIDRVTQMLTRAMENVGANYTDQLSEFDDLVRMDNESRARIARENGINSYNHYHSGL